ncbi:MAG TPA: nicotinamide riboside transporter PnuC [Steroidobacteraceae bacterium]|nr:nicotinamide riboside transporter PnuC [Steroidobacteraceae bacterium]
MIRDLLRALALTGPLELAAVGLGIVYVLLILKRNRLGWIAGGISSAIYVYLAASARLPMQSTLQAYYVVMAFYGWYSWTSAQQRPDGARIVRWPARHHLMALACVAVLSLVSAQFLARETHAAWPYLDSFTTWVSLLATWMVARMKLENWLYWIIADAITAFLFAAQAHQASAALFVIYIVIAIIGFREWLQNYRLQLA